MHVDDQYNPRFVKTECYYYTSTDAYVLTVRIIKKRWCRVSIPVIMLSVKAGDIRKRNTTADNSRAVGGSAGGHEKHHHTDFLQIYL